MQKQRISKEEIEHVAWLAHVELMEEEKNLFIYQLNRILEFFVKIDEIDTSNVTPTYRVLDTVNVCREDEPKETLSTDEALRNAPKKDNSFFKSPRIV